jgi:enterobactin synthetase component D
MIETDLPVPEGLHVSRLRYEYSQQWLDRLVDQMPIPSCLGRAVFSRKLDYLAGRLCAERALAAAGLEVPACVGIGHNGEPRWPHGFVGSITHSGGCALSAVGRSDQFDLVGIDLERVLSASMASDIQSQIATFSERGLGRVGEYSREQWLTLLFSAKESLFKALHSRVGYHFDFLDAAVESLDAKARVLILRLLSDLSHECVKGMRLPVRFHWNEDFVFTCCAVTTPS